MTSMNWLKLASGLFGCGTLVVSGLLAIEGFYFGLDKTEIKTLIFAVVATILAGFWVFI